MRLLRILSRFWRASFGAALEYRFNFALTTVTSLGTLVGGIFSLTLFYNGSYTFPGWSFEDCLVVLGVFNVLTGFSTAFLVPNLNRIVQQVEDGSLDFVLLKPLDAQFHVSVRQISPFGLPDLLLGIGLMIYGASGTLNVLAVLSSLPAFLAGMMLLYSMWFALASSSIWFVKIYNATEVLRGLLDAGRYPIVAFPTMFRVFFTFVVPVAFLTTVPAEVVLGRSEVERTLYAILAAVLAFVASRALWLFAQRRYTSASS